MAAEQTPYHAFYTTVCSVQYQSVSAVISAMWDKQSCVGSCIYLYLRAKNTLRQ
jgi:hypothetical protein